MSKSSRRSTRKVEPAPYNPTSNNANRICRKVGKDLAAAQDFPLPPRTDAPTRPGSYALFYYGDNPLYADIANDENTPHELAVPIYIGKAMNLRSRLAEHSRSIKAVEKGDGSLRLADFRCRFIGTDELFIGMTEEAGIRFYRPVWNDLGFGGNGQGGNRSSVASMWDHIHQGRRDRGEVIREIVAGSIEKARAEIADQISHIKRKHFWPSASQAPISQAA